MQEGILTNNFAAFRRRIRAASRGRKVCCLYARFVVKFKQSVLNTVHPTDKEEDERQGKMTTSTASGILAAGAKIAIAATVAGAIRGAAIADAVPRSFAQEVERFLAVHTVQGIENYGDFTRLVAQKPATGKVDATVTPAHKARKVRVWGALGQLELFNEMGLNAEELDPDEMERGIYPDVVFSTTAPGYCQGDVDMILDAVSHGTHFVTLESTDRWSAELARRLGHTYGGVLTIPFANRGGVFFRNCPKLLEGFPEGRIDAPLFACFGASRHGMFLTGDRCLLGVANTDSCRIATSVAQYKYGKGAVTLFGPCCTEAKLMRTPEYKRLMLNLITLLPPAQGAKPFDVLLYTRWKWHKDQKSGAVVPKGSFHHFSTESAAGNMARYFSAKGLSVKVTDDPNVFLSPAFRKCRMTVFACANEEQFERESQREAFYDWAKAGGGSLVLHSASNCEIGSAAWRDFLGGTFLFHYPKHFPVPFAGECDRSHPAIACLPEDYVWADDEIYVNDMVKGAVKPVLTFRADKLPQNMQDWIAKRGVKADNGRHIMEWTKDYGKGRVYYSALGHNAGDFAKEEFLEHLYRAALWTARQQ